jgi:PAS domain S-box-containing protein
VTFHVLAQRVNFEQNLRRDLIQQTAYFVLISRAVVGLATWVLFNEVFLPTAPAAWPIHVVFVGYFVANSVFCLRYRAGRITSVLVATDLTVNLGTMAAVAACTGGVASPVVLVSLFKIAGYAFIFGSGAGIAAASFTLLSFVTMGVGAEMGWWTVVPVDALVPQVERRIEFVFRVAVLGVILIGAVWFFRQMADKERQVTAQTRRAREAADRAKAAAGVTSALLSVSEAVSRLTRLDEILIKVVDVAPRVLGVDYCGIFLWNEDTGMYRGAAVSGVEPEMARQLIQMRLTPEEVPDLEWVRRLGHCAVIAPRGLERLGAPEATTLLTAPLVSGGRFYGVLQFARRGGKTGFTQRDITIADGVAGQTAVALERGRLAEESRRLVRAVESTGEAILITDRHRRIVFANPAFLATFGYSAEDLQGRDSVTLSADLSDEWLREVQRAVTEHSWRGEAVGRRKDGARFPIALHVSLIRSEDDQRIEGSVAVVEDISAQKKLQEQLARADRLAAAGELAAGVAHEVNNALTGILGQADLARQATDADTLRAAMERVEIQGRRIADVVQELLGFARPRPPERGAVDLRTLVRDTLTLMAHDLGRGRVRSETHFAPDLPTVLADGKQIQQVLVNLFTNALQAMQPAGGGALVVSIQRVLGAVAVEVQDTGPGIAPEALDRVFDPFFSTKTKGTGLGLSVSYAIARAHGGDLTVRSAANIGTTFTLKLPVVGDAEVELPRSVLLVDDDPAVADTLDDMLTREGLSVQRAATGSEALDLLARRDFDVVFLDLRLPDISGQEVYARLAAERPEAARKVVFVTGGLWRHDNRELRGKLPPQPTLSKPCTAAQIREVLRSLREQQPVAA